MSTIDLGLVKGRGISSIEKTNTQGSVDTYTIYYTDNTTSTFEVTNGSVDPNYRKPTIMGVLDLGSIEGSGKAGILVTNEDLIKQYEWGVYYSTSVSDLPTNYYDNEYWAHVVTSNVFNFTYPANSYHVTVKINAIDKNGAVCDSSILYIGKTGNFAERPD
jgi:hypothetical protein